MKIKSIKVFKNEPKVRLKVERANKTIATIYIEPCYESWEQYGAENKVLFYTMPIAERLASTRYFRNFKRGSDKGIKQIIESI